MNVHRLALPRYLGLSAVVVALGVSAYGCGAGIERGKILFGTAVPTKDGKCTVSPAVTSVGATTSVWATYVFKARPGDEVITLTIARDGQPFDRPIALPATDTKGFDCYCGQDDLSKLPDWAAGTFHFTLTSPTDTVAEGDLTVQYPRSGRS